MAGLGLANLELRHQAVLDALRDQSWKQAWEGEHGHGLMHECREETARFFGVDPEEVCFTRNATESNSIIAAGLKLEAGDEVIFELAGVFFCVLVAVHVFFICAVSSYANNDLFEVAGKAVKGMV